MRYRRLQKQNGSMSSWRSTLTIEEDLRPVSKVEHEKLGNPAQMHVLYREKFKIRFCSRDPLWVR